MDSLNQSTKATVVHKKKRVDRILPPKKKKKANFQNVGEKKNKKKNKNKNKKKNKRKGLQMYSAKTLYAHSRFYI